MIAPARTTARRGRVSFRTILWWAVVAALAATVAVEVPGELRGLRSDVEVGRRTGSAYRELQPARTVGLADTRLFEQAARILPRDATFYVVTGQGTAIDDPLVLRWVRRFARYRLLPRRLVADPRDADWILSYGGRQPPTVRVARVIRVGPGVAIYEVNRP